MTRVLAVVVAALLAGVAAAQGWTVQTVALRDLRQADAVVAQLKAFGLDAYDEFAMNDGKQFVRVRVGCFNDRAAAQAAADALAGHITKQAVPAPISPTAKVNVCVQETIGFLKPGSWKRLAGTLPSFQVVVAGQRAVILFDGRSWRVVQAGSPASPQGADPTGVSFVQAEPGGAAWVAQEVAGGTRLLCPGTLIGHAGGAAVVERSDEVVACRFTPPSTILARGKGP